jgi:hypothetical protein
MPPEAVPEVPPWLAQFPAAGRAYVTAWFAYARSQGAATPADILHVVRRVCSRKLEWSMSRSTEQLCRTVLLALVHQRPLAEQYAQTFLTRKEPADGLEP